MDACDDRHAGQEPIDQRLARVKLMRTGTRSTTLVKLPVALSGGNKCELRSASGGNPLDPTAQDLVRKTVDRDVHTLSSLDSRQLRFLVVHNHLHVWNCYYADKTASDIYMIAGLHLPLAYQAVEWRDDACVCELQLGRG